MLETTTPGASFDATVCHAQLSLAHALTAHLDLSPGECPAEPCLFLICHMANVCSIKTPLFSWFIRKQQMGRQSAILAQKGRGSQYKLPGQLALNHSTDSLKALPFPICFKEPPKLSEQVHQTPSLGKGNHLADVLEGYSCWVKCQWPLRGATNPTPPHAVTREYFHPTHTRSSAHHRSSVSN